MFPEYPYTDGHQLNLDWVVNTITELQAALDSGQLVGPPGPQGPQGVQGDSLFLDSINLQFAYIPSLIAPAPSYYWNTEALAAAAYGDISGAILRTKIGITYHIGNTYYNRTIFSNTYQGKDGAAGTVDYTVLAARVTNWLQTNITQETGYVVDSSLSVSGAAADAKTVGDSLNLFMINSPNLLNWDTIVTGEVINASGVPTANNNYNHSDYIAVTPGLNLCFHAWKDANTPNGVAAIAFYDANRTFTARYTYNDDTDHVYTIPNGVRYVILNIYKTSAPFMVNFGNAVLPYEPYGRRFNRNVITFPTMTGVLVVDKTGKGDYTTVAEAVANAVSGDTVVIMPGVYADEIVQAWGKTIHLVGVSKDSCIIKNATGSYSTPPIEMGAGSIENLTIIAEEAESTDPNGWRNYAVHVEDNNLFNNDLSIDNCTLISYNAPALGMGLLGGCNVKIRNCGLYGMTANGGSLFFHDAANATYAGVQSLTVINCDMRSDGTAEPTLKVTSQCMGGSTVNVRFILNNVYNSNGASYEISSNNTDGTPSGGGYTGNPWRNLINFNLTPDSYGNRKAGMNYN